jgi:cytochrome P450
MAFSVPRTSEAGAAFEEAVRYESPVQTFFRTTTRLAFNI